VVAVVLAALVALAPQILSLGPVKDFLFARASARAGMRISADQLSLSWFGNQTVRGLVVESADGDRLARLELVRLDQGLLRLATG
jgi:hypothetical protein